MSGAGIQRGALARRWVGGVHRWRHLILRRTVQVGVLLVFFGSLHWGWQVAGRGLLSGNLSSSRVLDSVPLSDPFATLQILVSGHWPALTVLLGAALVLAFYALVGGRVWCSWVCPVNMLTDTAAALRRKWKIRNSLRVSRHLRYFVLGLALALSALTGVAAFEWISPIGIMHRELLFGLGAGWVALAGLFLFDLFVLRNGWCGHLCPLGAFYALAGGRSAQVRVRFDEHTCTHCGECAKVCPEPQVLNLKQAAAHGMIRSGECTNCGRCIPECPENSLYFDWRSRICHPRHNRRGVAIASRRAV